MSGANEQMLRRFDKPAEGQSAAMDGLARPVALGTPAERAAAPSLIWEIGQRVGVRPASIHVMPPLQSHALPRPVAVAAPDDAEAGE
jgi:hypothetical protein